MRLKDILKEAANAKMAFKRPPGTSLTEDKPKAAPSDDKLKSMGNKKAAEMTGNELTGVTRSDKKEKDFKLKKKDVDASKVVDGYGNEVEINPSNPKATEQRAGAEVEKLKEYGAIRLSKLMARILPEAEEPEPTDNGEVNPPKQPPAQQPQGQEHQKSDSQAADQAHKLNLIAKPYGNWADDTGKVVAKTVKGQLTKIDPNEKQAKNADAPTDSGEFAPPSKSSEKAAEPQSEPSTKLSSIAAEKPNSEADKIRAQMAVAKQAIQTHGSATNALKAMKLAYKKASTSTESKESYSKWKGFERGMGEMATDASSDLYNTMEELGERGQADHPAFKPLSKIAEMGSEIEQDWTNDQFSSTTKAMLYDISRKYNEQLAGNAQSVDPQEAEEDMEELEFAMNRDREESEPEYRTRADYEADKADAEYDEWASSGKPKFWYGRRMR